MSDDIKWPIQAVDSYEGSLILDANGRRTNLHEKLIICKLANRAYELEQQLEGLVKAHGLSCDSFPRKCACSFCNELRTQLTATRALLEKGKK